MQEILDHVVFQLKLVDLDKKLGGGIILTGGGAMLKHVKQITELATGLNTRIGLPDQHLNGDASNAYAKELMNPMYSTCIGLILRGYYDFEQGNMRYTGENANYVKLHTEMFDEPATEPTAVDTAVAPPVEEPAEMPMAKNKQGKQPKKEIFEVMRNKFMKFFEVQADDTEFVE
jgi:cell division protein FtsA